MLFRKLDEVAAKQREREAAAEAKLAAKKAGIATGGPRIPDRTAAPVRGAEPTRSDSSDHAGGPPRLALAGNKPTWRERQAQKEAEAAAGGSGTAPSTQPGEPSPAVPPTDVGTDEAALPKRTGYVPPGRRAPEGAGPAPPPSRGRTTVEGSSARDDSAGGAGAERPTGRWMPRSQQQQQQGRDGSPAVGDGLGPRNLSGLRREGTGGLRDQSTDSRATGTGGEEEVRKPAAGKYIPMHLRNK